MMLTEDTVADPVDAASFPSDSFTLPLEEAEFQDEATDSPELLRRQASMILSAMDAAAQGRGTPPSRYERREGTTRVTHRQEASLTLHADDVEDEARLVFLRDVEPRAAGFISPRRLPLGFGGVLECTDFNGDLIRVGVTVVRCRSCYGGWFEGAVYFHQPKPGFGSTVSRLV